MLITPVCHWYILLDRHINNDTLVKPAKTDPQTQLRRTRQQPRLYAFNPNPIPQEPNQYAYSDKVVQRL